LLRLVKTKEEKREVCEALLRIGYLCPLLVSLKRDEHVFLGRDTTCWFLKGYLLVVSLKRRAKKKKTQKIKETKSIQKPTLSLKFVIPSA